jgi:hypothetical protein
MKKTILLFPILALALIFLAGCPPTKPGPTASTDSTKVDSVKPAHDYASALIKLERTVCYGKCPAYTLQIEGNGKVSYDGKAYVQVQGPQTSQIDAKAVQALVDEFFKIDYFALKDTFTEPISDMPTTITSISIDGKKKEVYDYYGAPSSLKALEAKIDEVANSAQWVKEVISEK